MRSSTMFLPAFCLYPVWLSIGMREGILVSSITTYYPMMIAMVIGSMIAGSTPLGGGVVAFPVSVLILGFTPAQGRDFSLMIQSVGMTAASFLILTKKRCLLRGCEDILTQFCFLSLVGLIVGFEFLNRLSPYVVNLVYTTTVACIVLVLAYSDFMEKKRTSPCTKNDTYSNNGEHGGYDAELCGDDERIDMNSSSQQEEETKAPPSGSEKERWITISLQYACLPLFAIFGGILSSQIGSGADIACFFYGSFYNAILLRGSDSNKEAETSANALTAVSVIVMANTSVFGSILRLTTRLDSTMMVDDDVYYALAACAPIVVLGGPVGSLFLTPSNQQRLKYIFYLLGIVQLLSFGVIKIRNDYVAWIAVAGTILLISTCLCVHYLVFYRTRYIATTCRKTANGDQLRHKITG